MSRVSRADKTSPQDVATFGFWLYLLSDVMIFGSLFATYIVLRGATAGGPSGADLFDPPYVLIQTLVLLTSSFTAAMALSAAKHGVLRDMKLYLWLTGLLGLTFLGLEINEFSNLVAEGATWSSSAFLSAFFTLVGTHGLHITIGLIWLGVLLWRIYKQGLTDHNHRKLSLFGLFWHFLDIVWIAIFTIVYMFGVGIT